MGLTYDLRSDYLKEGYSLEETAEFDRESTIEAIEQSLARLGHVPARIGHARHLVCALARGERWDIVFNIAEGLSGLAREAQVPAILDAYRIPYTFSDPFVLSVCLHKGVTKRIVREAGVPTPDFFVIEEKADIDRVTLPFPVFANPVAEGTGKGISGASKISDREKLASVCNALLGKYRQPVLVECFLSGREFTVGIVGTGEKTSVIGTLEIILNAHAEADAYSYVNKEECENLVEYRLVDDKESKRAEETALKAWKVLGCRDAGRVDLRSDEKRVPNFIEANPLAGLNPEHSDLPILCAKKGISYDKLIELIMESALSRI